jgi:hypothetical protein
VDKFFDALGEALHRVSGGAGVGGIFGADEERDFAFGGTVFEGSEKLGKFAAAEFFVELGDFAGDARGAVAEDLACVGHAFRDAVRGFIKNDGAILDAQAFEGAAAFAGAGREKTNEEKFFVGQAAGGKRGKKRRRSGDGDDRYVMPQAESDQSMAGIGNEGHARVADEGDFCALLERDEQFGRAGHFVVLVVADEGLANFVVVEKLLRVASVFASDLVDFLEDAQGAESHVFEIADRRSD